MKKIIAAFLLLISISSYSQTHPLDFFGQSESYCQKYLESPQVEEIKGTILYITIYDGLYTGYVIDPTSHRCSAVIISYRNKGDRKFILNSLNSITRAKSGTWYIVTEKLQLPVHVTEDKKTHTFIFQ